MPDLVAEPLIFPRGVWFPTPAELPAGSPADATTRIAESARTAFTTGYLVLDKAGAGWTSVVEANVHAPSLWTVFAALVAALLPSAAAPILCIKGEVPLLGDYTTTAGALAVLAPYAEQLSNDGFLEFGCIFQRNGCTEEVYVPAAKFIRVWTNAPERVVAVLQAHSVPPVADLRFIDEFPLVSQALPYGGETSGWVAVQEELRIKFRELPERPDLDAET